MKVAPESIINDALSDYTPVGVALLFSGGHDSLVSTHVSAAILRKLGVEFVVYHGDTTIGIRETQDYVKSVCAQMGWNLVIRQPPKRKDHYDELIKQYGFPGPTRSSHQFMYRRLKERALKAFVTHEVKSSPYARENVLLISGIRRDESRVRMGYMKHTNKEDSRVWCNPIFYWTQNDCEQYMVSHKLPRNPVEDALCISGECLCGAFAGKEEFAEIKSLYPSVARRIEGLHKQAKANGFPWPWSMGPTQWYKNHPPGQTDMFMCVGCENKHHASVQNEQGE